MSKFLNADNVVLCGIGIIAASPALYFTYKYANNKSYYRYLLGLVDKHGIKQLEMTKDNKPFLVEKTHVFQTTESSYSGIAPIGNHVGFGFMSESKSVVDKEGMVEYCVVGDRKFIDYPHVHMDWDVTYKTNYNKDVESYDQIREAYNIDELSEKVFVIEQTLGDSKFIHAIFRHHSPVEHIKDKIQEYSNRSKIATGTAVVVFSMVIKYLL